MRLDGKRTIVTGGAGGIGGAIALRMAAAGARVMIADLNVEKAKASAAALGAEHIFAEVDVTSLDAVTAMVAAAEREMGGVDVLVHSAGVAMLRDVLEVDPADWKRVIDINLMGTYHTCLAVARAMVARKSGGSLITISSVAAARPSRGASAYGAAKGGVVALTKALAVDLAGRNIRVNSIAPGPVDTEMARTEHRSETRVMFEKMIPMRRYARAEEIASAALFLASDESSYVSGSIVTVDGGYSGAGNMSWREENGPNG
jgi:NAD(P)-dependent dehydrogenase (short-subunit alcohol dehydrogenase family)